MTQWVLWWESKLALATSAGLPTGDTLRGSLSALRERVGDHPIRVVLPAEWGLITEVTVPAVSDAKLGALVAYAVEDQLATDLESQHLVYARVNDQRVRVIVIARALLQELFEELGRHDLKIEQVVLESDLLPRSDTQTQIILRRDQILWCAAGQLPLVLDVAPLAETLIQLANQTQGDAVLYLDQPSSDPSDLVRALDRAFQTLTVREAQVGLEPWLLPRVYQSDVLNVASGEFARHVTKPVTPRRLMPLMVAAGLFMVLSLVPALLTIRHNQALAQAERSRLETIAAALGQPIQSTADVRALKVRIDAALASRRTADQRGVVAALNRLAPVMLAHPECRLVALQYADATLELTVSAAEASDWAKLDPAFTAVGASLDPQPHQDPTLHHFLVHTP